MALLLPFLSTVVIGVADISRAYSQKLILEQAAYRAIEKVQQYQSTESTYDTLKNEVVSAATSAGMTDVTTSTVTVDYWLECNGVRQSTYDSQLLDDTGDRTMDFGRRHAQIRPMFASTTGRARTPTAPTRSTAERR